jgi:hypothetical protein
MLGAIVGILVLILNIIAIISVINSSASVVAKLLWILLILALPILGMVLYFLLGPGPRATSLQA